MTHTSPDQPPPERTVEDILFSRVQRRRDRIRAEIHRNRTGHHRIPTWVLAGALGLILLGWLLLILTN